MPPIADDQSVTLRSTVPGIAARLLRRLRDDRGYTLTELLTAMSIMAIVIATLASVFVSGSNAEVDLSNRYQAQQDARLALDRFRREVHNACATSLGTPAGSGYAAVTLSVESDTPPFPCGVSATWCAVGASAPYTLYRKAGATCDATGVRRAGHLTTNAVFTEIAAAAGRLPKLGIDLSVDLKPADTSQRYRLTDSIAVRNYLRNSP
jgi:prepilin-type N-terminal cleavage/methylation domain-containing protein